LTVKLLDEGAQGEISLEIFGQYREIFSSLEALEAWASDPARQQPTEHEHYIIPGAELKGFREEIARCPSEAMVDLEKQVCDGYRALCNFHELGGEQREFLLDTANSEDRAWPFLSALYKLAWSYAKGEAFCRALEELQMHLPILPVGFPANRAAYIQRLDELLKEERFAAQAARELAAEGSLGVSALLDALSQPEAPKVPIISALAESDEERVIVTLEEILSGSEEALRVTAACSLGIIASEHSLLALLKALTDPSEELRHASLHALTLLYTAGHAVPTSVLVQALNDEALSVRREAASALRGHRGVTMELIEHLGDEDKWLRYNLIESLKSLGTEAQAAEAPLLRILENDPHEQCRLAALKTLIQILPEPDRLRPRLHQCLKDKASYLREAALRTLRDLGPGAELQLHLGAMISALEDQYPHVRGAAALGIGALGAQASAAKEALKRGLSDENAWCARRCAEALSNIQTQP